MAYFKKDAKNPPCNRCLPCWTWHNLGTKTGGQNRKAHTGLFITPAVSWVTWKTVLPFLEGSISSTMGLSEILPLYTALTLRFVHIRRNWYLCKVARVHPFQRALKGSYCTCSSFLINSADALSRLPVDPPDNQDAIETKEYAFSIANEAVPTAW